MTTITVQYDENNKAIKKIIEALRSLGAKVTKKKETSVHESEEFYKQIDEAKEMVAEGNVNTYGSAAELIAHIESL